MCEFVGLFAFINREEVRLVQATRVSNGFLFDRKRKLIFSSLKLEHININSL